MNIRKSFGLLLVLGSMGWGSISGLRLTPAGPYTVGQVVTISWTVNNSNDEFYTGIYFSRTGSAPWDSLAGLSPTATSYLWTVPNSVSSTARIWVYHKEAAARPANPPTSSLSQLSSVFMVTTGSPVLAQTSMNPFSLRQFGKELKLDRGGVQFREATLEISSLNGTVMREVKIPGGFNSISVSTDELPVGMAIVRLSVDGKPQDQLLLIQR